MTRNMIYTHNVVYNTIRRAFNMRILLTAVSVISLATFSETASSQTRFHWADSRFDIGRYQFIETCRFVTNRVLDSVAGKSPQLVDSLHHSVYNGTTILSPAVVESTKRCLARFVVDEIPLKYAFFAQDLYLVAGEDDKAAQIVNRRLASIPPDSLRLLSAAFDSALIGYLEAQPVRLQAAFALHDRYETYGSRIPARERVNILARIAGAAWFAKDSTSFRMGFDRIIRLAKSFDDTEWGAQEGLEAAAVASVNIRKQYASELASVLKTGTKQYFQFAKQLFTDLVGRSNPAEWVFEPVDGMVSTGGMAPPLEATYWYPAKASGVSYPRKGTVTLIVTVKAKFTDGYGSIKETAIMQRLKAKFPDLEIVILAATSGYFNALEPPTPEHEAALNDSLYRQFFKMPGVLAVTNTKFWRLPGYDRRRINEPTVNEANGYPPEHGYAILVDKEGAVVLRTTLIREQERELERLIPMLINQASSK